MPVRVINLRQSASGGGVADQVRTFPAPFALESSRLVILIHGYNDTLAQARQAYASFLNPAADLELIGALPRNAWMAYLEQLKGNVLDSLSRVGEVCLFFWPGDPWGRTSSALAYSEALQAALTSAIRLKEFVLNLALKGVPGGPPLQVILICHSMGNRLGLETAYMLRGAPNLIRVSAISMMAAAVPVLMVTPNIMAHDLTPAVQSIGKTQVLFSVNDGVLGNAFALGELEAGEGSGLEAVGRFGNPYLAWSRWQTMYPYGHGDYWPGPRSRDAILTFLGEVVEAKLAASAISPRSLPDAATRTTNRLRQNYLSSRTIGG